jgi:hypothetical protein
MTKINKLYCEICGKLCKGKIGRGLHQTLKHSKEECAEIKDWRNRLNVV